MRVGGAFAAVVYTSQSRCRVCVCVRVSPSLLSLYACAGECVMMAPQQHQQQKSAPVHLQMASFSQDSSVPRRDAFEASSEFYCIVGRTGVLELVSDNVVLHTGHSRADLEGQLVVHSILSNASAFDQSRFSQILNSLPTDPLTKQTDFDRSCFSHSFNCDLGIRDDQRETYLVRTASILYKTSHNHCPSWCLLVLFRKGILGNHNLMDTFTVEQFCTIIDTTDYRVVEVDTSCSPVDTCLQANKSFLSCVHELDRAKVIAHFESVQVEGHHKIDYRLESVTGDYVYTHMTSRLREITKQILSNHTLIRLDAPLIRQTKSPVPPPNLAHEREVILHQISGRMSATQFKRFLAQPPVDFRQIVHVNTREEENVRRIELTRPYPKVKLPDMDENLMRAMSTKLGRLRETSSREIRDFVFKTLEAKFGRETLSSARDERRHRLKKVQAQKRPSPDSRSYEGETKLRRCATGEPLFLRPPLSQPIYAPAMPPAAPQRAMFAQRLIRQPCRQQLMQMAAAANHQHDHRNFQYQQQHMMIQRPPPPCIVDPYQQQQQQQHHQRMIRNGLYTTTAAAHQQTYHRIPFSMPQSQQPPPQQQQFVNIQRPQMIQQVRMQHEPSQQMAPNNHQFYGIPSTPRPMSVMPPSQQQQWTEQRVLGAGWQQRFVAAPAAANVQQVYQNLQHQGYPPPPPQPPQSNQGGSRNMYQ